jgi:hypothetical protein
MTPDAFSQRSIDQSISRAFIPLVLVIVLVIG